jgi:transcriptional regulator with GAF, ATPase, and Fis domain
MPSKPPEPDAATGGNGRVLSATEVLEFERANLVRALESCSWKVSGEDGAARLMGLPAWTLSSRMKALGIRKPTP